MVLVHQGDVAQGETFFADRWPGAVAIADPDLELYGAFGIGRGSLGQVLGPRTLLRGLGAGLRGHGPGRPVGDVWRMPGTLLLHEDAVIWEHVPQHVGDQPDLSEVRAVFLAHGGEPQGVSSVRS